MVCGSIRSTIPFSGRLKWMLMTEVDANDLSSASTLVDANALVEKKKIIKKINKK
jgi:hypothetical protein